MSQKSTKDSINTPETSSQDDIINSEDENRDKICFTRTQDDCSEDSELKTGNQKNDPGIVPHDQERRSGSFPFLPEGKIKKRYI